MKNNKRGFTLIELLAVIALLAVVALIIMPGTLKIIENSKKDTYESSVKGLIESFSNYIGENDFKPVTGGMTIEYIKTEKILEAKNISKFISGTIYETNGTISVTNLTDGKYCANGKKNSLVITEGSCVVEVDDYGILTMNYSDITNFRSGQYLLTNGLYSVATSRICLNDYVTVEPSATYKVTLSNTNYNYLVRVMSSTDTFISSFNVVSGSTFTVPSNGYKVGITLYNRVSEVGINFDTYRKMFSDGFSISVVKQ